jgi:hypothetical protein
MGRLYRTRILTPFPVLMNANTNTQRNPTMIHNQEIMRLQASAMSLSKHTTDHFSDWGLGSQPYQSPQCRIPGWDLPSVPAEIAFWIDSFGVCPQFPRRLRFDSIFLQVTTSPGTASNSIAKSLEHALSLGAPIEDLQDFNAEAQGALSRLAESDFRIMTHGDPLEVRAPQPSPQTAATQSLASVALKL